MVNYKWYYKKVHCCNVLFVPFHLQEKTMTEATKRRDVVSGIWKFQNAKLDEILKLAGELKDGPDGENYLNLHVRSGPKGEFRIGFMYKFEENEKDHDPFFYKMTDRLKRRFGNFNFQTVKYSKSLINSAYKGSDRATPCNGAICMLLFAHAYKAKKGTNYKRSSNSRDRYWLRTGAGFYFI